MRKSEWSDNELEDLLRQMPKIQDHRDPRDIYQNLSLKRRKMKPWIVPSLAAAAAILLFFILIPQFMNGTNFSFDHAEEQKSSVSSNDTKLSENTDDSTIAMKKGSNPSNEIRLYSSDEKKEKSGTSGIKTAVYEDEVGNGKVLTYWIPDHQAQILIPVSILVSGSKGKSWLTLFNEKMASLKEEDWGLADYYPLNATMKLDEKNNHILVDVPSDHQYGQGSAMELTFVKVLNQDIYSNSSSKKIKFTTDGKPGIQLGNYGDKEELDVVYPKRHAFFFYYPEGSDLPFLTPSTETYTDVHEALEAMKADPSVEGLKSSLLPLLPINDISIMDKTLIVSFKGNTSLQNTELSSISFEALLLTAKEFGLEKVVVKDSPLTNIGSFDLSKETRVPVAPNLRTVQ